MSEFEVDFSKNRWVVVPVSSMLWQIYDQVRNRYVSRPSLIETELQTVADEINKEYVPV